MKKVSIVLSEEQARLLVKLLGIKDTKDTKEKTEKRVSEEDVIDFVVNLVNTIYKEKGKGVHAVWDGLNRRISEKYGIGKEMAIEFVRKALVKGKIKGFPCAGGVKVFPKEARVKCWSPEEWQ